LPDPFAFGRPQVAARSLSSNTGKISIPEVSEHLISLSPLRIVRAEVFHMQRTIAKKIHAVFSYKRLSEDRVKFAC
jgi:hypothetical protein